MNTTDITKILSIEEMQNLPIEEVKKIAPKAVFWAVGGTRRHAVLKGIKLDEAYYKDAMSEHLRTIKMLFDQGVETVFTPGVVPTQVREVGEYREKIFRILSWTADEMYLPLYQKYDIRVKFFGFEHVDYPGIKEKCQRMEESTKNGSKTLWWFSIIKEEDPQLDAIKSVLKSGIKPEELTQEKAVECLYGEAVPQLDVVMAFGKFYVGSWMPPLLGYNAALYFLDFPNYEITEKQLREVFWDYRFARKSWQQDKSHRYDNVHELGLKERHDKGIIWGVGTKIGPFWYHKLQ